MPKLLDFIKDKGLTHEQVIEILEKIEPEASDDSEEELEEEEEEVEEESEEVVDDESSEEEESENIIQISKTELSKLIAAEVSKTLKAVRKAPAKGKKAGEKPTKMKPVIERNMFEVWV